MATPSHLWHVSWMTEVPGGLEHAPGSLLTKRGARKGMVGRLQQGEGCEVKTRETITGRVKWFSSRRKYGFIQRDSGKGDVFVHQNDVSEGAWLSEGDRVRFFVVRTPKGPRAFGVQKAPGLACRPKRSLAPRSALTAHDTTTRNSSFSYTIHPRRQGSKSSDRSGGWAGRSERLNSQE